jgi:hypothetical protein
LLALSGLNSAELEAFHRRPTCGSLRDRPGRPNRNDPTENIIMPILLWLLGIPIPIIILLILFFH